MRSRGRDERHGYPPEDELRERGARRPGRPEPDDWSQPAQGRERGDGDHDRYGHAGYDEQRGYRGERGRDEDREREREWERERSRGDGGYGGRTRRGYDEYDDAYGQPRRDGYDAYPDAGWDERRRGGPYAARPDWDESEPRGPVEDSWGLPALTGPEVSVPSWTEEWQARAGGPPPRERGNGRAQPGRPARPPQRPSGKAVRRKQRSRGLVVVQLLAIALAVIAGGIIVGPRVWHKLGVAGGASTSAPTFATYTPGPTPTVVAGFKQLASTPAAFVLNYPQDWSQSSQNDTSQGQPDYLDTFAQGGASVTIERSPAFDSIADTDVIQAEVRGGQQAGLKFTETTSAAGLAAIGGEQWTRREYDVTSQNGKEHMAIFACHHNGHGFALVLRAPADSYAQVYSTSFKTVLSSFRFTA